MQAEEIDYLDPVQAFAPWAGQAWSMLMDSAVMDGERGRYSYICIAPFQTLICRDGQLFLDGKVKTGDPFNGMEALLARHVTP
ncbi:MAG: hypothetical protein ABL951_16140, partial [Alphaproteobacteria bacterium]